MRPETESKENLVESSNEEPNDEDLDTASIAELANSEEYILSEVEKRFLLSVERGDLASVKRMLSEYKDTPEFSINCVDPLNRSALITAIENENYDLMTLLLEEGIQVKDAILYAISEEYIEAVEKLLQWEEETHIEGKPYSWEAIDAAKSNFTPDITPLILAAHRNNYEILKVLLDRGASLPMPHDVKCGCDECVTSQQTDSLRHSQSRINAFKALSSSSLISLSSRDPILTAFELSWELKRLQTMESEFRSEYLEMRNLVQAFSTSLLDHVRTSNELEIMLNFNHEATTEVWEPGDRQTLERLKLAIKYKQKNFVAHPNVQQLLAAIWYEGLPGFRRKTMPQQIMDVAKLGCMFPVYSINYILKPDSEMGKFMKKPFVKFISHSASYAFFLTLLGAASQRVEYLALEIIGLPWMLDILDDWKKHERGAIPGPIELCIIMYITSLIFAELKRLYAEGIMDYIQDLWNIIDFISNTFYMTWILCRFTAFVIVRRDAWFYGLEPWFPRENWHPFDPMLLSEGAFAAGMIFSFLKLVHIFSINPHLGPLQVSLGRMIIDIIKFFFIYTLVLFAFGCGLNQLLWYYADLEKHKCYHLHPDVPDFDEQEKACTIWRRFANLFETSQSLFWASFGLVDLVSFDLAGIKSFTRFWALLMFGSYSVINIIVLLNMLIAMMSNSYQIISERADVEWKFARSQLWMSYFEDGDTVPPPFNLCPSVKLFQKLSGKKIARTKSIMRKTFHKAVLVHDKVMRLLVRRFITAEQSRRDDMGITEDDIIEVRQDISSLRYELMDIFDNNHMKVPDIEKKQAAGKKKGKLMERRIMKDFQIGIVESLATEMSTEKNKDIFSSIAKVLNKRQSSKSNKTNKREDWNAIVRKNTVSSNPIGSTKTSMVRRSQRSLRRKQVEDANAKYGIDTNKLLEINPKLSDVTPTTRVAYVKFMSKTLERRDQFKVVNEKDDTNKPTTSSLTKPALTASTKLKEKELAEKAKAAGSEPSTSTKAPAPSPPSIPNTSPKPGDAKTTAAAPPTKPNPSSSSKTTEGVKDKAPTQPAAAIKKPSPSASDQKLPEEDPKGMKPGEKKSEEKKSEDKKTEENKLDQKKPVDGETGGNKSDDKKTDDKKSADCKSDDKKSSDKPADKPADNKPEDKKPSDGKTVPKKPDDKDTKPGDNTKKPPPAPITKPGQSSAAAGGDRGKSTVTGRMISGWL